MPVAMTNALPLPTVRSWCAASVLAVLVCAGEVRAAECKPPTLPAFDATGAGGWAHVPLSKLKRDTRYGVVSEEGRTVVRAVADRSASMWVHLGRVQLAAAPMLEWRWRVPALIAGAANEDPKREDAPVRLIVGFDGDKSQLPQQEQRRMSRAKSLSGRDMPYATLMYIWDNRNPVDTVVPSAHTSRVKMLVVESGPAGVGAWRSYRRDLARDYERAFGEKPKDVLGFALMTDTDNTGEKAEGVYGALRLACATGTP
jgi:hypothetical protein